MNTFVLQVGGGGSSCIKVLDQNLEETVYVVYSFAEGVILSHTPLFYEDVVKRDALHV